MAPPPTRTRDWSIGRVLAWPIETWRAIDADAAPDARRGFDWRVLVVLMTCAVSLTLQEYVGDRGYFQKLFPASPDDRYWQLKSFVWWSGWRVGGYFVLPALVIACMPGERLRDYYLSTKGVLGKLWIYLLLYALVLPLVLYVAQFEAFYRTYPFYKLSNRSAFDYWAWQGLYAAQFVSLEFFFRGFLTQGLRRALGSNAVFVQVVPYCMIHYGKPLSETFGAIFTGLLLGTLAMRYKSIWGGALLHVAVACTMDRLGYSHCPPPDSHRQCLS